MIEMHDYTDPKTGYQIRQLTSSGNNIKFYFSSENWLPDDRNIVFLRTLDGKTYVSKVDDITGEIKNLTDGDPDWAVGTFSLDRETNTGYIMKKHILYRVDALAGKFDAVAELPEGTSPLGHLTVSKSGLVCNSFKQKNCISAIYVIDPKTGAYERVFQSDYWLSHAQICPGDDNTIFFVHETGGDALQRMWLFDLKEKRERPYFVEKDEDNITHETWAYDGSGIYFIRWPESVMFGDRKGQSFKKLCDGTFHHPGPSRDGKWITADTVSAGVIQLIDVEKQTVKIVATCKSPATGAQHSHPSFNRRGDKILFTSPGGRDADGKEQPCNISIVYVGQDTMK